MNEEILKTEIESSNIELQKKKPKRNVCVCFFVSHALIKDAVRLSRKTE